MKQIVCLLGLPLVAGCLASAPPAPTNWTIQGSRQEVRDSDSRPSPSTLRVADVVVRAPYSGSRLAVLRPNGSLAFDAYNVFAATPSKIIFGAALEELTRAGRFAHVIDHGSQAHADFELEITVTRLALDCRAEGQREALVELTVVFLDLKGSILSVESGRASVPVTDGNYSEGFSRAFSQALEQSTAPLTRFSVVKK